MTEKSGSRSGRTLQAKPVTGKLTLLTPADDAAMLEQAATEAALVQLALAAVRQAPESQGERIALLRKRIREGAYHVPDQLLVQRILDFKG